MVAKHHAIRLLAAAALLALCAPGCVYRPVQIGGPMFGDEALKGRKLVKVAAGKACAAHILYAIPAGDDSMEAALDELTGKGTWAYDVVTVEEGSSFWLVGWSSCTRITGYAASAPPTKFKTTLLSSADGPKPDGAAAKEEEPSAAAGATGDGAPAVQ
jgi:hypothetical protein